MYRQDKFEIDTTPKTFTPDLKGLAEWMALQNPQDEYQPWDRERCLIARFLGRKVAWAPNDEMQDGCRAYCEIAAPEPHTFGAALERARALLNHAQ